MFTRETKELGVLVAGPRDIHNDEEVYFVLDKVHQARNIDCVIQGAARGIDTSARNWAEDRKIRCDEFPANWKEFGKSAGFLRNKQMLEEGQPNLVVIFRHSDGRLTSGTSMMKKLSEDKGLKIIEVKIRS